METEKIIENIKNAIKDNDATKAVENDMILQERKKNASSEVYSQSKLHESQINYIKNFKLMYHLSQLMYIITAIVTFFMFLEEDTIIQYGYIIISCIFAFFAFAEYGKHLDHIKNFNYLIYRMNIEKTLQSSTLIEIDIISEFQNRTQEQMRPLYERYYHDNPPASLANLLKNYENNEENQ